MAQARVNKVGGPRMMGGPRPKVKNPGKILMRLIKIILKDYKWHCLGVAICIIGSTLASVRGTLFMQTLIDDYIEPMIGKQNPDFGPLLTALSSIALIYAVGVFCSWAYNRIMVNVSQGTMRNIRVSLFTHMQSLPIRYFDTHAHGDIMSVYTNDIDTLRQMISQSIPQLFSSIITIVSVFCSMLILSIPLTVVTVVMVAVMLFSSKKLMKLSARYFIDQQRDLGKVNGYIEEMMDGQKVVKVFCHEEENLENFRKLNEQLRVSAKNANSYANIVMPVMAQLGNVSYAICAVVGALLAINNYWGISIGIIVSFLTLNKSFNQPISQCSQQINNIIMALGRCGTCVYPDG